VRAHARSYAVDQRRAEVAPNERITVEAELDRFLVGRSLLAFEIADWSPSRRSYPVELRWYACDSLPPEQFVVSVRAVVLLDEKVLVITDKRGERFVVPGGRRERNETFDETLKREVLEECGWHVEPLHPIAVLHIRALDPKSPDLSYPYPDSLHVAYVAQALGPQSGWSRNDDWVETSEFIPMASAHALEMREAQHALLQIAEAVARQRRAVAVHARSS
jgi:ADP-ribose pyrophosphatase YjhB (NUDIX family)